MKKKFMAIFIATPASTANWQKLDEKAKKESHTKGFNAWKNWAEKNAKAFIDTGSPLGKTKLINKSGISDTKNQLTAYTVVEAESHEEAAKLFLNHPHFTIFPGESIEIMECLPIPQG